MGKFYASVFLVIFLFLSALSLQAETYYVSAAGKDSNSGASESKAWLSITKVNSSTFVAGDTILFEGGREFDGSLYFSSNSIGSASRPIVIGSYGTGKATIKSNTSSGVYAYNTAGYKIENLIFAGAGRTVNKTSGIFFYMDQVSARLNYIAINNVEVYGYRESGILIGSWKGTSGYDNISITNSSVHDNGDAGISSYAEAVLGHRNMYIGSNKVYNNAGIPEKTSSHSGSGIMIGGVDGVLIEYCEAYNNGWLNAWKTGGPVGIWGYKCNNLVIQHNEAYNNKTGTTKDGGGFDIDGGCTNSVMQYNYSHDNDGAGYLVAQYSGAPVMKGITIRYNISENDGRKNGYGGIHLWSTGSNGGIQDLEVYNNTVYVTPSASGTPRAFHVQSGGIKNAKVWNNILQTTGGLEVVRVQNSTDIRFEGNNYWSSGSALKIFWVNATYAALENWRQASSQEMLNGIATGLFVNPELKAPGKGIVISCLKEINTLDGYKLEKTSKVIRKGLDLASAFKLNPGKIDFWKNSIEQSGAFNVGACQEAVAQVETPSLAPQTIAFGPLAGKILGAVPFALQATASSGLPVSFKIVAGPATLSGNMLTLTGIGTVTVEASQGGNSSYAAAAPVTQSFIVAGKTSQTIAFASVPNKVLGDAPFALSATATSGLPVSLSIKSGPASIAGNIVTVTGEGVVVVEAAQAGNDTYAAAAAVTQGFTVSKASQMITFAPLADRAAGSTSFALSASASSGLPVSFSIATSPSTGVASLSGNTLTLLGGTGTVTVTALQAGNASYSVAQPVQRGFAVTSAVTTSTVACSASGTILREQWNMIPGKLISSVPVNTAPSSSSQLTLFEANSKVGDRYAARIRGYVCPPATGDYTFWVSGDDAAELWLSTDDSPSRKVRIAFLTSYTNPRQWDKHASQKSAAVRLEAGKRYYIEALHKEEWGGDHLAVGWQLPNGSLERPIAGSRLSPYEASGTLSSTAVVNLSKDNFTPEDKLMVYPNPVKDQATVEFDVVEGGKVSLDMFDLQGKLVKRFYDREAVAGTPLQFTLNAEGLTYGVYIVRLTTAKKTLMQKVVLAK